MEKLFNKLKEQKPFTIIISLVAFLFIVQSVIFQVKYSKDIEALRSGEDLPSFIKYPSLYNQHYYAYSDDMLTTAFNRVGENINMVFKKVSIVNGNTVIEGIVLNELGIGLSKLKMKLEAKKLTDNSIETRGKNKYTLLLIPENFEDDKFCEQDFLSKIDVNSEDIQTQIPSGTSKYLKFIFKDVVLTKNYFVKINIYAGKLHYRQR